MPALHAFATRRCHNRIVTTLLGAANSSWSFAPGPVIICVTLTVGFLWRYARVRREARTARGVELWRPIVWMLGVLSLVAALISPIDNLAEQVFVMHMTQHLLLIDIAPILLTVALSKVIMRPVARTVLDLERGLGPIAHPVFAVVFYVAMMSVWHIPALYDAALESDSVHVLEHVCFGTAGMLYWWHLLSPVRGRHMSGIGPVMYMVTTKVGVGLLGIVLTFAPTAMYSFYERGERVWGLSPLDDQAASGALMALEQSIVMGIALGYLFVRALSESDRRDQREDAEADRRALSSTGP